MPRGALRSAIRDVDGDGRADEEWAELRLGGTVHFGIRTASGGVIGAEQEFAGGGDRTFVAGRLADGRVIALVSEGRDTTLWTFTACRLVQVHGVYSAALFGDRDSFVFSSATNAGSAGCLDGRLVGFDTAAAGRNRVTILTRRVTISTDGRHAVAAAPEVLLRAEPDGTMEQFRHLERYFRISCTPSRTLRPVVKSR